MTGQVWEYKTVVKFVEKTIEYRKVVLAIKKPIEFIVERTCLARYSKKSDMFSIKKLWNY